jgi:hypothetical protein
MSSWGCGVRPLAYHEVQLQEATLRPVDQAVDHLHTTGKQMSW